MKIIHNVQVEEGDTLSSITKGMSEYLGKKFDGETIWDFNRNHMPTPHSTPPIGTILRFPHDPADESGGPSLEVLSGKGRVSHEDLEKSSTVLGGVKTPATEGGEVGADNPSYDPAKATVVGEGVAGEPGATGGLTGASTVAAGASGAAPAPNPGTAGEKANLAALDDGFTES